LFIVTIHGHNCDCDGEKADTEGVFIHAGDSQGEPGSDFDDASRSSALGSNIRRNRAFTIQSEGGLAVFTNGYHIPMCKHNNMDNKRGLMHVVPCAHSIHSPYPPGVANRSVDNLPHPSTIPMLGSELHIKDSTVTAQKEQRMVKSNDGHPFLTPVSHRYQMDRFLPPLDLSNPHASVSGCFRPSWAASCPVSGRFIVSRHFPHLKFNPLVLRGGTFILTRRLSNVSP
jgi:hypothetical protein